MHTRLLKLSLSAAAMLVVCQTVQAQSLIWSEEFDQAELDRNIWTYDVGGHGFGNWELQYYTARPENVWLEDGHLIIQALREPYKEKQFSSARVKTHGRFAFKYGTIEARVRVPDLANGLWPAFWLLGNNIGQQVWPACGEIDILEMGMKEAMQDGTINKRVSAAAHWEYEDDYAGHFLNTVSSVDLTQDFHLYKMEWTPTTLTAYLDGVEYWSLDISQGAALDMEEFHEPFYILVNMAVGGINFVDITDPAGITAPMPAQLEVDWIRLYDNGDTELFFGEDTMENGPFGVFTEETVVDNELVYEEDAALYVWNNMTATEGEPLEGEEAWTFHVEGGNWFGLGAFCLVGRNMANYENGFLHFSMKTTSTHTFDVGIASSDGGEGWLDLVDGGEEFGLVRDGQWHDVAIPLSRFSNIDFNIIMQIFMFKGEAPGQAFDVAIDDVYWTPSENPITPETGNYALFSEDPAHKTAGELALGVDGHFYIWEGTLLDIAQSPYEGEQSLSFTSAPGLAWFGAAFTPNMRYNLSAFRHPESMLHFAMKSSSNVPFQFGMRSGSIDDLGQKWIEFRPGNDPYGFVRDGQWHVIDIPMTDISDSLDLTNVSMMFEILGVNGGISDLELDDICFLNGHDPVAGGAGRPIADAGENQTLVLPASSTTLDGSASHDDNGTIVAYAWEQVSGPTTATITGADTATPNVADLVEGAYIFRLTVTDDEGLTGSDSVTVTVASPNPTVNAGGDKVVTLPDNSVALTGSASDADGEIVAYQWSQVTGPATATLTDADTETVSVSNLYEGTYVFELVATDNDGLTGSDLVTVEVIEVLENIALGKLATASSQSGGAPIANGGFELGTGAAADGWNYNPIAPGAATAVVERVNTDPYSGNWCLRMAVAGAAGGGPAAEALQPTAAGTVTAGETYNFEVQAKRIGDIGPGAVAQVCVQWLDADGSDGGGVKGTTGFVEIAGQLATTYRTVGIANIQAAAGADSAYIILRLAAGAFSGSEAEILFDEAVLSAEGGDNIPAYAVDGDDATRWTSAADDPTWIQVDLDGWYEMEQVVLKWGDWYAHSYTIEVSRDGEAWSAAYATTNGLGGDEVIDIAAAGDYIRLVSQGGVNASGISLYEFEVYGSLHMGDIDGDGDIDLDDLAALVDCLTGPGMPILTGCDAADLDGNAAVDLMDFAVLQRSYLYGQ